MTPAIFAVVPITNFCRALFFKFWRCCGLSGCHQRALQSLWPLHLSFASLKIVRLMTNTIIRPWICAKIYLNFSYRDNFAASLFSQQDELLICFIYAFSFDKNKTYLLLLLTGSIYNFAATFASIGGCGQIKCLIKNKPLLPDLFVSSVIHAQTPIEVVGSVLNNSFSGDLLELRR